MNKRLIMSLLIAFMITLIAWPVYADPAGDAILSLILGKDAEILMNAIKQMESLGLIQEGLEQGLLGTHSYGSQYYNEDNYRWGGGSDDWQSILAMSRHGASNGALSDIVSHVSKQFPVNHSLGSTNAVENEYYELQARTAIAARSGSELAFNQTSHDEENIRRLHRKIDQAEDSKSATDLNNRFASENAMLSIQQTKLLAMLVQQAAVDAQARSIRAQEDKDIFTVK